MRWGRRTSIEPRPAMPRLDRERAALSRLATATDDAALAEWARLRLRASEFVAVHATPTPAAIEASAARDRAAEPLLAPPPPLSRADGATLVDVTLKLPMLDRLAVMNASRRDVATEWRVSDESARSRRVLAAIVANFAAEVQRETARVNRRARRGLVAFAMIVAASAAMTFWATRSFDDSTQSTAALIWMATMFFFLLATRRRSVRSRSFASARSNFASKG